MKKFLLSLAAVALAGSAWADTAYLYVSATAPTGATTENSVVPTGNVAGNSYTAGDIIFSFEKVNSSTSNVNSNLIRWYANDKIAITAKEGADVSITSVKMTCSTAAYASNVKIVDPNNVTGNTSETEFSVTLNEELTSITLQANAQVRFSVLEVTYGVPDNRDDPNLSFSDDSVTVNLGATFDAPVFDNPYDLPIVWTSSNEDVATVDENGIVNIKNVAGSTTITASFEDNNNDKYKPGKASYTITVVDPNNVTFDFVNNTYGMTRYSGSSSEYNSDPFDFSEGLVTITLNGKTRLWSDGLRLYSGAKATFSVPTGYKITDVVFQSTGNSSFEGVANGTTEYVISLKGTSAKALTTVNVKLEEDIQSGVEAVEFDNNAPKEYYNLQGVRVENPGKGLYIVRQGSKASKVIL